MVILRHLLIALFVIVLPLPAVHARDYDFDNKISRPVLENYLSRSITNIDGVAVFNRVLKPEELKALAFNDVTQTK
jgi:hypothetical protein